MAIEYSTNTEAEPVSDSAESETVTIPMSILGGKDANPGDVVRLEVVSKDEDGGSLVLKYATETEDEPMGGIDGAAAAFEA